MKWWIKNIIVSVVLILAFIPLFDFEIQQVDFSEDYTINVHADSDHGGNTVCTATVHGDTLRYRYTLGTIVNYPYALAGIESKEHFNLEEKDLIQFRIHSERQQRPFMITNLKNAQGKVIKFRQSFEVEKGTHDYTIRAKDFVVPEWFLIDHRVSKEDLETIDFSDVEEFCFSQDTFSKKGDTHEISVSNIHLSKSNFALAMYLAGGLILVNVLLFGFRKKKLTLEFRPAPDLSQQAKKVQEDESEEIINYINSNYTNPDLSLKSIRNDLKIPENKISNSIKSKVGVSYKEYVLNLRIEESKRLLNETEMNINEIAYATGFASIVTFNRVFKNITGTIPSQFMDGK